MLNPRYLLFAVLFLKCSYEVSAMDCSVGGIMISCPTVLDDSDKIFCCKSSISNQLEYCCDGQDFLKQNPGILAGILIGALLILVIILVCCCCFCSCCYCARRRTQRGTVYGPISVTHVVPPPSFNYPTTVHAPLPNPATSPPPYQPLTNHFGYPYQPRPENQHYN